MLALSTIFAAEVPPGTHVWHFWIAVVLAVATVLAVVATMASYFFKVTRTRYPKK